MRILLFGLILIGLCIIFFGIGVILIRREERKEKKRRKKAAMCKAAIRWNTCPHCCDKCLYGEKL